jgi:hypothetical protein
LVTMALIPVGGMVISPVGPAAMALRITWRCSGPVFYGFGGDGIKPRLAVLWPNLLQYRLFGDEAIEPCLAVCWHHLHCVSAVTALSLSRRAALASIFSW